MRPFLITYLFLLIACSLAAQITFLKKYQINTGLLRNGQQLPNENYVMGYNETEGFGKAVIFLTDKFGAIIWAQSIISANSSQVQKVVASTENEIYALIETGENLTVQSKLILVKFNEQGQPLWSRFVGDNLNTDQDLFATSDGHIITSHNLPQDNIRCIKFNKNGDIVWSKIFTNNNIGTITQITEDNAGNYWILARGQDPNTFNNFITHLIKILPTGIPVHAKSFDFPNPVNLSIFPNNDMAVTGFVPGDNREFIMRLNPDGAIDWADQLDTPFNIAGAYAANDGHLILTGIYNGPGVVSLMKMSGDGDIIWERGYNGGVTNFRQAFLTTDGIAVLGRTINNGTIGGLFLKTDMDGRSMACDYFNSCTLKEPIIIDTMHFDWSAIDFSVEPGIETEWQSANLTATDFCAPANAPLPFFEVPDTICQHTCIGFNELSQADATAWEWSFEEGTPGSSTFQQPGEICYDEPGTFELVHTVYFAGCADSYTTELTVVPVPEINLGNDTTLCNDTFFELNTDIAGATEYFWNDGQTGPSRQVDISGNYRVDIDFSYCILTDSVYVDIISCNENIFSPTAFSPNNDGINDFFEIFVVDVKIIKTQIFNRWGGLVFNADLMEKNWDGNINGEPAEVGTYIFLINYIDLFSGKEKTKSGEVFLIR
ncbi:MAG: gliding motility-associated C-terminal domain-containing protein [Bacteroidota bacterium]